MNTRTSTITLAVSVFAAVTSVIALLPAPAKAFDMATFKGADATTIMKECEAHVTVDKADVKAYADQFETCRKGIQEAANDMILTLVKHSTGADSWRTTAVINACGNKYPGKVMEIDVPAMAQCLKENLE